MGVVLTAWVQADGEVIRQDLGMGLTAQLEPETTVAFNQTNQTDLWTWQRHSWFRYQYA